MSISKYIASKVRKRKGFLKILNHIAKKLSPDLVLVLDFPCDSRQRWDQEHPHLEIRSILDSGRSVYESHLSSFNLFKEYLCQIPRYVEDKGSHQPYWNNDWMPALDGVALYAFLAQGNPGVFMEVGSGNSTKFARQAIRDHNLRTKIVSIDPKPRAAIDEICDEIIRDRLEDTDLQIFDQLNAGDILYIDNSHRTLMNSDSTVFFLDVMPKLKPGVIVQIHDIMLPFDYPEEWIDRHYSEQYLLAAYLLARGNQFDVMLPNTFISTDDELKLILGPLWDHDVFSSVETHGCSFWLKIRS